MGKGAVRDGPAVLRGQPAVGVESLGVEQIADGGVNSTRPLNSSQVMFLVNALPIRHCCPRSLGRTSS
jgi:hypothetical protein